MARSRYSNTKVLDGFYYSTWRNRALEGSIEPNMLDGISTVEHFVVAGERLDHLAARYFGDDQYYWVIALVNSIANPLDISPGQRLLIPNSVKQVLDKLM